mmetsp:Transcript_30787/g.73965  ORF Transcript_30787/g.73965 Transcript_30787/m.73965 type:complete len:265 (+) Transcript_30787:211-1005(+)
MAQAGETPAFQMPQLSKVAPLILMITLNKFDFDKMGYRQYCEFAFIGVQIGCWIVLMMISKKINEKPDNASGTKIKIPAEMVMGNEAKPAREMTEKEYDLEKFSEARTQQLMGGVILCAVYYNWQSLMPLIFQTVMAPLNLTENPLFLIYMLKKEQARPFPKANPFGLPETPAAPAAEEPQPPLPEPEEPKTIESSDAAALAAELERKTAELASVKAELASVKQSSAGDDALSDTSDTVMVEGEGGASGLRKTAAGQKKGAGGE